MKILIATDQHHKQGMEKIIQQFGFDKRYFFLGDITAHYESIEEGGKDSKAKKRLGKLKKEHPNLSYNELLKIYVKEDVRRSLESYGKAIPYTIARLRFLEENQIRLNSISGNVDKIMDLFLSTLNEETGFGVPTSLDFIRKSHNLLFYMDKVECDYQDKTEIINLPYCEGEIDYSRFPCTFSDRKSFRLILTHENPHPEGIGEKRPAKMQKSIDFLIDKLHNEDNKKPIYLACGHLHVSGDPYEYRGITVLPLGPDDVMEYDCDKGGFRVLKADNH